MVKFIVLNERGFTLLEMLLVLLVVAIVTLISSRIILYEMTNYQERDFFEKMHADLYYAQSYAMGNRTRVRVNFNAAGGGYAVTANGKVLKQNAYPKTVSYQMTIHQVSYIEYTNLGSISQIMRHKFNRQGKTDYEIIFYIGKGRQGISM